MWAHINDGQNLNGAHDSLIDAKAQSDVFLHPHFIPYVNKKESIQPIDEIFTKTTMREWKKEMEPTRPVHSPWIEISKEKDVRWSPTGDDVYTSSAGGGNVGPSSEMQEVIRSTDSLAAIFMFMVPLTFFTRVAQFTDKFCYKDWVIEKFGKDRDGDEKKRRHFVHVPAKQGRHTTPGRRHRADKEKKKIQYHRRVCYLLGCRAHSPGCTLWSRQTISWQVVAGSTVWDINSLSSKHDDS